MLYFKAGLINDRFWLAWTRNTYVHFEDNPSQDPLIETFWFSETGYCDAWGMVNSKKQSYMCTQLGPHEVEQLIPVFEAWERYFDMWEWE